MLHRFSELILLGLISSAVFGQQLSDFPYVDGIYEQSGNDKTQCGDLKKDEELRLDKPSKGRPTPVVRTRSIDQGSGVGDCSSVVAINLVESYFNKAGINMPEVSYLSLAIQSKLDFVEKDFDKQLQASLASKEALSTESLNQINKTPAGEKKDYLLGQLSPEFVEKLTPEEVNKAYVGLKALEVSRRDNFNTVIDNFDPCLAINNLNEHGYCPKQQNVIEESLQQERIKKHYPIYGINHDKYGVQLTLFEVIEDLYRGLLILNSFEKKTQLEAEEVSNKLIYSWETEVEKIMQGSQLPAAQLSEQASQCANVAGANDLILNQAENIQRLTKIMGVDYMKKTLANLVRSIRDNKFSLKEILLSAVAPNCTNPDNNIKVLPPIICETEHFPSFKVVRRVDKMEEERRKIWDESLDALYMKSMNDLKAKSITLDYLCNKAESIKYHGGMCNSDKSVKSLEEFKRDAFVARNSRTGGQWITPEENNRYRETHVISNKVMNLEKLVTTFNSKLIDSLKVGSPVGVGLYDEILKTPNFDGAIQSHGRKHIATIIGVRRDDRGCHFLVKDSRGPNMSYSKRCKNYNARDSFADAHVRDGETLSTDCEPGLIWVPADELSINTQALYRISN